MSETKLWYQELTPRSNFGISIRAKTFFFPKPKILNFFFKFSYVECWLLIFGIIDKPKNAFVFFHNEVTSINFWWDFVLIPNSLFFFLGILISKKIVPAYLFSFQLRVKTPFHKYITDDSYSFLWKWNVKETPKSR